jgi:hypothetical protein
MFKDVVERSSQQLEFLKGGFTFPIEAHFSNPNAGGASILFCGHWH